MNTSDIPVGVVGLGLMGCSISACLLMAGHPVIALAPIASDLDHARARIEGHLKRSFEEGIILTDPETAIRMLTITEDYAALSICRLVIESTIENLEIKKVVYGKIESFITQDCILVSNTSAIPISILQKLTGQPNRFLGLHWAEPSHTTRFLEIICGDLSDIGFAEYLYQLSHSWGKEPILVRKDIRGFITNRLMYAMYREAFYLVENGYATIEDVDRSCRNNAGYFMTLVGIFRWMDLTGVAAYHNVMKDLFPELNNTTTVPKLIDDIVKNGGRGIANQKGFYEYSGEDARLWEETFTDFTYEIRQLALKYPADIIERKKQQLRSEGQID